MADWIDADVLEREQNPELPGAVDIPGEAGDPQSVSPAGWAAVRALDEDDDEEVFYCEKEVLLDDCVPAGARSTPEPRGGAALAPEELSFAWPAVRAAESVGPPAEAVSAVNAARDWTSPKAWAPEDIPVAPVGLVPDSSAHQGPTELQTFRSLYPDTNEEPKTPPDTWVRSQEETVEQQPQEGALPHAATAPPEKVCHLNGERRATEELLGESLQDVDEEESDSQGLGEAPPTGGRRKSPGLDTCGRYNTVSYRKIRKGNTKQKIDTFESLMNT
ncbi:ermin [Arapaima gigas]